jgi:hypothetical protein
MNSVIAAIIAALFGALVAFYLYFYKNEEPVPNWTLALLRFAWTGLLIYAIVAPDLHKERKILKPEVIVGLLDTSSSVSGDVNAAFERVQNKFESSGIQWISRVYNEENIPLDMPWVYVGDGHISTPQDANNPNGVLLLPSIGIESPDLIYGVSITKLATTGNKIPFEVQCEEGTDIEIKWHDSRIKARKGLLIAPELSGNYSLEVVATKEARTDRLQVFVQVVDNFRTIALVTKHAHPHEMMLRRWAKKNRYALVQFESLAKAKQSTVEPIIAIGEKPRELESTLWLSGSLPTDFEVIKQIKSAQFTASSKVLDPITLAIGAEWQKMNNWDFSGVHWYKSALMDPNAAILLEEVLDGFLNEHSSIRPSLDGPQRLYANEQTRWVTALLSGSNVPQPSEVEVTVLQNGEIIDRPRVLSIEGPAQAFNINFPRTGSFNIRVVHSANGTEYVLEDLVTVYAGDAETKTPLNKDLMNQWSKEGWIVKIDSLDSTDFSGFEKKPEWISIKEKNPQHAHWWYWGFVLLLASSEWLLRRRRGMV